MGAGYVVGNKWYSDEPCPRCQNAHKPLPAKKLKHPQVVNGLVETNYWATCPVTKAPILIKW